LEGILRGIKQDIGGKGRKERREKEKETEGSVIEPGNAQYNILCYEPDLPREPKGETKE
jgi:hypothetical protein